MAAVQTNKTLWSEKPLIIRCVSGAGPIVAKILVIFKNLIVLGKKIFLKVSTGKLK